MSRFTALLFIGPEGPGVLEGQVAAVRIAAAVDAIQKLAGLEDVERILVVTSEREWSESQAGLPVAWDFDDPELPFHFGRRLARVIEAHRISEALYLGAGSIPLLSGAALAGAIHPVGKAEVPLAVTNNLHSSDWIAFNHARRVPALADRLPTDNSMGWVLQEEGGFEVRALPPSAASRLDIDTPTDALALALQSGLTEPLQSTVKVFTGLHPAAWSRYQQAARTLSHPGSQIVLAGRVSSSVWGYLERHTQVWIRVISEERGMAASGRLAAGVVRSLLADYLEAVGERRFFEFLAVLGEAVFMDTRVLLAHHQLWPSAADRYASDLGEVDLIEDGWLRDFTRAAVAAPVPVVLGGHGVVAGGLYALVAAALSGVFIDD